MKHSKILLLATFVLLTFASCSKKPLDPEVENYYSINGVKYEIESAAYGVINNMYEVFFTPENIDFSKMKNPPLDFVTFDISESDLIYAFCRDKNGNHSNSEDVIQQNVSLDYSAGVLVFEAVVTFADGAKLIVHYKGKPQNLSYTPQPA